MDADGVPHAGLWLNDTINGTEGSFLPLSTPAVSGNRLYIISLFKPQKVPYTYPDTLVRLYAIDVHTTIVNRLEVAWKYDLTLKNAYIPQPSDYHNTQEAYLPLSSILVQNDTVVASVNVVQYHTGWTTAPDPVLLNGSSLISITDGGSTVYTMNYAENMDSEFSIPIVPQTMNYCGVWPGQPPPEGSFICQDEAFFMCVSTTPNYRGDCIVYNTTSWPGTSSLETPVGAEPGVTAQTMAIQVTSTPYTSYGIVQGLGNTVYAFNMTSELVVLELLWTLHFPVLPMGQMATVDGDRKTLLVITTETGVNAYVIGSV